MAYNKYLIVASKKDKAGINITTNLSQFRKNPLVSSIQKQDSGFDFYLIDDEIIFTENLDMEKINKYDFIIFASKHKSEKGEKSLTIHAPGNFRQADFGGETGKICKSSALFQKQMFEKLKANADKYESKYDVTLEATHHGPLIDKPCVFIEIGSSENEWVNRQAGFIIAKTINEIIQEFKENPYNEIAIGIGGPHYCPNFNKIQLKSNIAISHIIPQYTFPLTEEMVKEAIEKTEEEIDFAILDWKGLGNAEQRQEILDILDKLYIRYEKTSDVKK
jgi:D-aminoacyl-tRNA deacylase|tara:strand:+ start:841 stop:1671 length:831 start_codon:yes stop_codon:yes gene_type:complete